MSSPASPSANLVIDGTTADPGQQLASRTLRRAGERYSLTLAPYSPEHPRNDHAQIFALADGRLIAVWSEYYVRSPRAVLRDAYAKTGARDDAPCQLTGRLSADNGRTWSGRFTIQENVGASNVKQPNLLRLANGDVLLLFTAWDFATHQRSILCRRSTDDCESWGEPVQLTPPGGGVFILDAGRIFRHSSGRIIVPVHWTPEVWNERDHCQALCYVSDDEGATWRDTGARIDLPGRGAMEPQVVERQDGTLLALLRSDQGCLYRCTSSDRGETWSEPAATELIAPQSESCLRRMPAGPLLLLWNRTLPYAMTEGGRVTHHPRNPLSAAMSTDDGESFTVVADIENRLGYGNAYPNVFFAGDEAMVTFYQASEAMSHVSWLELRIYEQRFFTDQLAAAHGG